MERSIGVVKKNSDDLADTEEVRSRAVELASGVSEVAWLKGNATVCAGRREREEWIWITADCMKEDCDGGASGGGSIWLLATVPAGKIEMI